MRRYELQSTMAIKIASGYWSDWSGSAFLHSCCTRNFLWICGLVYGLLVDSEIALQWGIYGFMCRVLSGNINFNSTKYWLAVLFSGGLNEVEFARRLWGDIYFNSTTYAITLKCRLSFLLIFICNVLMFKRCPCSSSFCHIALPASEVFYQPIWNDFSSVKWTHCFIQTTSSHFCIVFSFLVRFWNVCCEHLATRASRGNQANYC